MNTMQGEVHEAFRDMGAAEDKALKAAVVLSKRDDDVGTLKSDMAVVKWMIGFVLAMQVAVLFKVFTH